MGPYSIVASEPGPLHGGTSCMPPITTAGASGRPKSHVGAAMHQFDQRTPNDAVVPGSSVTTGNPTDGE